MTCYTANSAFASDICHSTDDGCIEVGHWDLALAVGLGARSNPLRDGDPVPLVLVPQISYYGEKFFLNNLDFGYTLFEDVSHSLNLIATPGYDRVFFHRSDLQNIIVNEPLKQHTMDEERAVTPMSQPDPQQDRDRHITYLSGLDWSYGWQRFSMQLSYLHEITGEHHGNELRFAAAVPVPLSENWPQLSATVGATWKSSEMIDYYYGEEGIYTPKSAVNPFVKLGYKTQLNSNWTINIFGHYEKLGNAVVNSPIVDKNEVLTLFIGGIYSF